MLNGSPSHLARAFLCLLALASGPVFGAGDDVPVLRFNVSPNGYPPYLIVKQDRASGIMWDVMERIASRLGYRVVAERIPRKRVDQMLLDGFIDATPRAREWTAEPDKFLFTDPVVHIEEVFFVPSQSPLEYQQPEDLFSRTVVTHLGYLYPPLEPYFQSGKIQRFDVARDRNMFTYLVYGQPVRCGDCRSSGR